MPTPENPSTFSPYLFGRCSLPTYLVAEGISLQARNNNEWLDFWTFYLYDVLCIVGVVEYHIVTMDHFLLQRPVRENIYFVSLISLTCNL